MEDVTAAEIRQMIYDLGGLGVTFHDPDEMDGTTIGRVARTPDGRVQVMYDLERIKTPGASAGPHPRAPRGAGRG